MRLSFKSSKKSSILNLLNFNEFTYDNDILSYDDEYFEEYDYYTNSIHDTDYGFEKDDILYY